MAVVFDAPDGRGRHRVATGSDAVQTFNSHMSRSGETADTLLYIVNYDDTQGFAVISAPQNVEPVIAVVEKVICRGHINRMKVHFRFHRCSGGLYTVLIGL